MLLLLAILIMMQATITYWYYEHQNKTDSMGGRISATKAFWLGFVLFHYFIFPIYLYFWIMDEFLERVLCVTIAWFYLRLICQGLMMFIFHNWTPRVGIIHNLVTAFLLLIAQIFIIYYTKDVTTTLILVSGYLFTLIAICGTDTFYAYRFSRIVGQSTQGKQAIWYASDTSEFRTINTLTSRNNIIFIVVSIVLLIIMYYDKY